MAGYAVAHLRHVDVNEQIAEYLERIDATLEPYGGRFLVHGGDAEVLEGPWEGHLIVIEFPDRERARAWYRSEGYQDILHLRTDNAEGDAVIVEGVGPGHRATDVLPADARVPEGNGIR